MLVCYGQIQKSLTKWTLKVYIRVPQPFLLLYYCQVCQFHLFFWTGIETVGPNGVNFYNKLGFLADYKN